MIAIQHHLENDLDRESVLEHESFADSLELTDEFNDSGIWNDWCLDEVARGESGERQAMLGELIQITLSSLSSYHELAELATEPCLRSFADVMIRQRGAQVEELRQLNSSESQLDLIEPREALSAIRSVWRLAIWYFEQNHQADFVEYAERAESLLEEAFLAVANRVGDDQCESMLRNHAIAICGARSVWEDLGERSHSKS